MQLKTEAPNIDPLFDDLKQFRQYYNYLLNLEKYNDFKISSYINLSKKQYTNYLQNSLSFDSFNINIKPSIDFIRIFCPSSDYTEYHMRSIIYNTFTNVHPVTSSNNIFKADIIIDYKVYSVFLNLIYIPGKSSFNSSSGKNKVYLGTSIRIKHPDIHIINYIESILINRYKVSAVEYTIDIRCNEPDRLMKIMSYTALQGWAREGVAKRYPILAISGKVIQSG